MELKAASDMSLLSLGSDVNTETCQQSKSVRQMQWTELWNAVKKLRRRFKNLKQPTPMPFSTNIFHNIVAVRVVDRAHGPVTMGPYL